MKECAKRKDRRGRPPLQGGCTPWPLLVFPCGKDRKNQVFCTIPDFVHSARPCSSAPPPNKLMMKKSIPELRRKHFWASCYGWLLVGDDYDRCFLFNPATLSTINLPVLDSNFAINFCTLSCPPGNPNCTVFIFHNNTPRIVFCRPGDRQWAVQDYEKELRDILGKRDGGAVSFKNAVGLDGKLYALTSYCGSTVVIKVEEKDDEPHRLKMRSIPFMYVPNIAPNSSASSTYMLESSGDVLVVTEAFRGTQMREVFNMQVHRLDLSRMKWVEVKGLKDRMLFLSPYGCVSCPATETGTQGNRIYFTIPEDKSLYSFNMEQQNVSAYLPWPDLPEPWYPPAWVMPDADGRLAGKQAEVKLNNEIVKVEYASKKDEETDHAVNWSDLPFDMWSMVAKHLNLFDYLHFREVHKEFQLAAPSMNWKTASHMLKDLILSPWLVFFKNDSRFCNFIDPANGYNTFKKGLPELLLGAEVFFSRDGWLLMSKDRQSMCLFNPMSGELIKYPEKLPLPFNGICCSTLPTSSDCLTIAIHGTERRAIFSYIRSESEEREWVDFEEINSTNFTSICNPVFMYDTFYFLGVDGNLGVLDLNVDYGEWDVLAKPKRPCKSFRYGYLADCDGEVLSVFVGHSGEWVEVFQLDWPAMVWVKVESLGNYVLFVSRSSCVCAVARTPEMENKIYFPRFYGQSQNVVFYSLETKRFHCHGCEVSLENFYGTTEQTNCCWIEPQGF
ncbi:uncharacterized protein LOC131145857 [Malania oleifera]|uniref:uncharacterized protein LOC131145857 n=1 Tax=Malania oleifera TaxID=397392 RepID=UPI0025ADD499|nr:uncharacterized protein LOC131145857 [Malania oleifera]